MEEAIIKVRGLKKTFGDLEVLKGRDVFPKDVEITSLFTF